MGAILPHLARRDGRVTVAVSIIALTFSHMVVHLVTDREAARERGHRVTMQCDEELMATFIRSFLVGYDTFVGA